MAYTIEAESGDVVINGWENGMATSPHEGIANLQCANISTIPGEVLCNFNRTKQTSDTIASNTVQAVDATHVALHVVTKTIQAGTWITIGASSTITNLTANTSYYVKTTGVSGFGGGYTNVTLATAYAGSTINNFGVTGTSTFVTVNMGKPLAHTFDFVQTFPNYEYFVLDTTGNVWRWTNAVSTLQAGVWAMINAPTDVIANSSGLMVYGKYLLLLADALYYKLIAASEATIGGETWTKITAVTTTMNNAGDPHNAILGHDNVVYWTDNNLIGSLTVKAGNQMTAFDPTSAATFTYTQAALTLPSTEVTNKIAELNTNLAIGCWSNNLYFWNRTPQVLSGTNGSTINSFFYPILLPENYVQGMLTVNNLLYVFCGQKGNIYVTNATTVSAVITIPDYSVGQIEPYYIWGESMYLRGRIWFSVNDSNGKVGGIWSFVPQQSYFIQEDVGASLRLENQSSYGTYSGISWLLFFPYESSIQGTQVAGQLTFGPQYWSAWDDGTGNYGIDTSAATPYTGGQTIIETDMIRLGSYIQKANLASVQTRYSVALVANESVQLKYRTDLSASWSSFGDSTTGTDNVAGSLGTRFPFPAANFMSIQFQIILTSIAVSPSYVRFRELRLSK